MGTKSDREASIPNPLLKPLGMLTGTWNTVGTHPLVPGTTFHGRTSFEWLEGVGHGCERPRGLSMGGRGEPAGKGRGRLSF